MLRNYMDTRSNSRANTCTNARPSVGLYLLDPKAKPSRRFCLLIHNNLSDRFFGSDMSKRTLPYQLSMVLSWRTMAFTGDGESGFDSGEGA
jgi:hypothetical protein